MLDSPTSEPSKYSAQVPLVVAPSVVGVKASRSSSFAYAPVTETLPKVLISMRPSGVTVKASISSSLVVSPTSEPSKYHVQAPAVVLPVLVGVKRRISACPRRRIRST